MEILVGTKTSEAAKRDDFQPLSRSEVKTCQQKASGRLTRLVLPRSTPYWFVVPGLPPLVLCVQACQHTTVSGVPDEALVGLATLEAATSIQLSTTLGQPDDCVSSAVRIGEVLARCCITRSE